MQSQKNNKITLLVDWFFFYLHVQDESYRSNLNNKHNIGKNVLRFHFDIENNSNYFFFPKFE